MAHARINIQRMLSWIEERLDADKATPNDAEICERFGFDSSESARTLLAELADAGKITIRGYGETRTITLGRTRGAFHGVSRPVRSVVQADADVERTAARIMEIAQRGRKPARAIAAENAQRLLASVNPKPVTTRRVALPLPPEKPTMPDAKKRTVIFVATGAVLAHIETRMARENAAIGRVALELAEAGLKSPDAPAAPAAEPTLTVDALLDLLRQRFADQPDRSAELDAAVARAGAAEARAEAAEAKLAQMKALFA